MPAHGQCRREKIRRQKKARRHRTTGLGRGEATWTPRRPRAALCSARSSQAPRGMFRGHEDTMCVHGGRGGGSTACTSLNLRHAPLRGPPLFSPWPLARARPSHLPPHPHPPNLEPAAFLARVAKAGQCALGVSAPRFSPSPQNALPSEFP